MTREDLGMMMVEGEERVEEGEEKAQEKVWAMKTRRNSEQERMGRRVRRRG